ncbi:MAG: sulfotransferase domain-containing protein [Gemmatimonadota bacterium]
MGFFAWTGVVVGAFIILFIIQVAYLSAVLKWEHERTIGLAYYGLPPAQRAKFKRTLKRHAILLSPILWFSGKTKLRFQKASFTHRGIAAPMGSCNPESFAKADTYQPTPADVFVVTQMKCGTTWMQHVVYQVLLRGRGDLVESGTALYAVSPWIEALKSVPIEQAPTLGTERPSRIIKTHLPSELCPWSPAAKYVYVARHPVSCFASCIDFVNTNVGAMAPAMPVFEEWYCSPQLMWWGTWPNHVKGWWEQAQANSNVLFIHFEDMKRDLPGVIRQVASFLGMKPLSEAEVVLIAEKCGFRYMQENQGAFEMHPPHLLATNADLFVRGSSDRHKDVPADVQGRIAAWAAREVEGSSFPLGKVYPDVIGR